MKLTKAITLTILSTAILTANAFAKVDLADTQFGSVLENNTGVISTPSNLKIDLIENDSFTALVEEDYSEPEQSVPVMEDIVIETKIEQPDEMKIIDFSRAENNLIAELRELQELEAVSLSMGEEDEIELVIPDAPIDAPMFVARND